MRPHPTIYGPALHRHVRRYKEELLRQLFGKPRQRMLRQSRRWPSIAAWNTIDSNIVGIGYGIKQVKGSHTGTLALCTYVRKKLPLHKLRKADRIPSYVNGLPTDVVKVGRFKIATQGGYPCLNPGTNPGTIGGLVAGTDPNNRYILSCLHVLAADPFAPKCPTDNMAGETIDAPPGGPGIAELWHAIKILQNGNTMDCAVARVFNPDNFDPVIKDIGRQVTTTMPAYLPPSQDGPYQEVIKSGAMSGVTHGLVIKLDEDHSIPYGSSNAGFVKQIGICGIGGQPFAEQGDSGSLVLDAATKQPIALVFAVDAISGITLANPIQDVLDSLGVHFV